MQLSLFDWIVIGLYFVANLAIALYYARRAGGSTSEFFLSGRNAPWWLAGTSMVATTFAADTPLAVTGLVAKNGVAGNWIWWSMVMSGMMTVFFYARLWRRAGVMTDVEFAELRYSGKPAAFLRGFRALYLGVPINCIILGWVSLAMLKILKTSLDVGDAAAMGILVGLLLYTAFYTTLAGLWGVYVTDMLQFALKMGMVILLAIFAVKAVGGMDALQSKVATLDAAAGAGDTRLAFLPPLDSAWMPAVTLCTYLAVTWWSTWYPGAEPGGGGYVAQRIFSAKDERHGVLATLWFNVAHYALRPWPWIVTALASIVLYPDLADKESGYVMTFMDPQVFPTYLRGFMLAGFAAAYMSTIATQLNWGASYVVNDFYRRFAVRHASERHYVYASQAATALIMLVSLGVTFLLARYEKDVRDAWELLMATGAGTGAVYLLRWYWWRINAWSEVSALVVAAITSILLQQYAFDLSDPSDGSRQFAYLMLTTVGVTSAAWVAVTFLTRPEPTEKLVAFYRTVRPAGPGWAPIARVAGDVGEPTESLREQFVNWILGCVLIYSTLFGIGHLVFQRWAAGLGLLAVAGVAAAIISRSLSKTMWRGATAALVLAAACTAREARAQDADAPRPYRVIAYLFGRTDVANIGAEKLTHINYAFALVSDEGRIVLQGNRATTRLAELRALRERHPHLKILLSVGGWGADHFSDAALTDASREKFAASGVELLLAHDLDGIDLDWEYPGQPGPGIKHRPEDKQNFTLMLAELRRQLDDASRERSPRGDQRLLLTIASAAGRYFDHTEMDRLHEHLDWINIMTYDMVSEGAKITGHHTGLFPPAGAPPGERCVESYVDQHLAAGIPPHKLVIGAAFYGRGWTGVNPENNGLRQSVGEYAGSHGYDRLARDFINKNGFTRHWDAAAHAPFLWNPEPRTFISYDDPKSLAAKAAYVKERGLGGVMFWEYSQDLDEQLLDALSTALR